MPASDLSADLRLPEFTIALPTNWYVLDLDPHACGSTIARLVEERLAGTDSPQARQARQELTGLLRGYVRRAASRGAVYVALMDQVVDGMALSAALVVAVGDAPRDLAGEPVLDPVALGQALIDSERAGRAVAVPGQRPDLGAALTQAGAAARLRRTIDSGFIDSTGRSVATAESQYFVPVPGTDKVLAMTFSTPNLAIRATMDKAFDVIASTLDWVWDSEDTLV